MTVALANQGFTKEFAEYIAANSGLGYVAEKTLFIGQSPDALADSPAIIERDRQELTIYSEGGGIDRSMRLSKSRRIMRFVVRGTTPNDAVERAWAVLDWLEELEQRHLPLTSFSVWNMRNVSAPSATVTVGDGTTLADFVQEFSVQKKAVA